jgi:hypothetical protein
VPRPGLVGPIACLLVALAAAAGCNDKVVHLGDGRDGGCVRGQVSANEVLWIGDSWILMPGSQRTRVRELARNADAIGDGEDYVNAAAPGTTMAAIAGQYTTRQMGATKVKVLLMDGGTWDTIVANMTGGSVASAAMAAAADFAQLLTQVASDGTVEHIIYFLVPELAGIPGVAILRPLVQQSCAGSSVACHFLDLQPLWAGHPEYTAPGDTFASEAGAMVLGDAIWGLMQEHCIAQ